MIWVKSGIEGEEELAKLLNNLEKDERYDSDDWEVLVECIANVGSVFYTVIFRSAEDP